MITLEDQPLPASINKSVKLSQTKLAQEVECSVGGRGGLYEQRKLSARRVAGQSEQPRMHTLNHNP